MIIQCIINITQIQVIYDIIRRKEINKKGKIFNIYNNDLNI